MTLVQWKLQIIKNMKDANDTWQEKLCQTGISELTLKTRRQPLPICRSARSSSDIKDHEQEVKDIFDSGRTGGRTIRFMRSIKQHWRTKSLTRWLKINIPCRSSKRTNRKHVSFYVLMRHVGNSISPRVSWHNPLDHHRVVGCSKARSETILDSLRPHQ